MKEHNQKPQNLLIESEVIAQKSTLERQRKKEEQQNNDKLHTTLFIQAASQRKSMNLNNFKSYMDKRVNSYQQRSRIFENFRAKLYDKQKLSKKTIQTIIKYFTEYESLLRHLQKSIKSKLQLKKKYQNFHMQAALKDSIEELVDLNDKQWEHLQKFRDWIDKILIQAFKASQSYYKDRIKKFSKDLQKIDFTYYDAFDKQQKYYEKLSEGNDLLEKELGLIERIKITDEAMIDRGVQINQAWQAFLDEQKTLKKLLRENIIQFYEEYIKFHKKIEAAKNLYAFWNSIDKTPKIMTVYHSILSQKEIAFILFEQIKKEEQKKQSEHEKKKSEQVTNQQSNQDKAKQAKNQIKKLQQNFQSFLRLGNQQKRIGNPYPFLQILVVKKFKSKIQKGSRQWRDIKLIFSVDKNLLVYDQKNGKCIQKLVQSSLKLKRISENILEVVGTELGFILDSTRRETIHFDTLDQVEEFIFYVENVPRNKQ